MTGPVDKTFESYSRRWNAREFLVYELELPLAFRETTLLKSFDELERIKAAIKSAVAGYPSPIDVKLVRQEKSGLVWERVILVIEAADRDEQQRVDSMLAPSVALAGAALRRLSAIESVDLMPHMISAVSLA